MKSRLRILHLEDDAKDAELVQETLAADGIVCRVTRVDSAADFVGSLERGGFDLILADYTLPAFDGFSALKIAQDRWADLPFIFVSGTLGEEVAIEALKIGATDYVFKTRLSRVALRYGGRYAKPRNERSSAAPKRRCDGARRTSPRPATEPHRQLRLGRGQRKDLLVSRDLSDIRIRADVHDFHRPRREANSPG